MTVDEAIEQVKTLSVGRGDAVLVQVAHDLPTEETEAILSAFEKLGRRFWPDRTPVVVVGANVTVDGLDAIIGQLEDLRRDLNG